MEHEVIQGAEIEDRSSIQRSPGEDDEEFLARLSRTLSGSQDNPLAFAILYSQRLHLNSSVTFLALNIANAVEDILSQIQASAASLGAASVYIASHIFNQPRSLTDVSALTTVSDRQILRVYDLIYYYRYDLVDEDWRQIVGSTTLGEAAEVLPTLTWPPFQHDLLDSNGETVERFSINVDRTDELADSLDMAKDLCYKWLCSNIPDGELIRRIYGILIYPIASDTIDRMNERSLDLGTLNPWTIAAASMYMASYLVFQSKTLEEVSAMSGIPCALINNAYRAMHNAREQIVGDGWFTNFSWISWTRADAL